MTDPAEHVWTGRRLVAGDVELCGGRLDGQRVWMPAGPLRPYLTVLEPEPGALIPVRSWRAEHVMTRGREVYRLADEVTADGLPVYVLERRRHPRGRP